MTLEALQGLEVIIITIITTITMEQKRRAAPIKSRKPSMERLTELALKLFLRL
jgi:hypothetical protein